MCVFVEGMRALVWGVWFCDVNSDAEQACGCSNDRVGYLSYCLSYSVNTFYKNFNCLFSDYIYYLYYFY